MRNPNKLTELTDEQIDAYLRAGLVEMAREFSPRGYEAYTEVVFGTRFPKHVMEEWIRPIFEARAKGMDSVIRAFRGALKTTALTIGFVSFFIGHHPTKANLLIQVGDPIAQDNTGAIARLIAENPGWKLVFPHIVPDYEKGWGASGYEVKDTSIEPGKWAEMNASRKDPTFVGLGYASRAIIGKHPDGILLLDDIHDENNTSSEKELSNVIRVLVGTILKACVSETWKLAVGTPWVEGDALDYLEKTGLFTVINTPIFREKPGSPIVFNGTPIELTWPEEKGLKYIENEYASDLTPGKSEFHRMLLLDLTKIQQRVFTWQSYPAKDIVATWPMTIGCDYAGTMNEYKNRTGDNDYFALAYVMKLPTGGAVIYDGVREHCTQDQAEMRVLSSQAMFRGHIITVVEADGKGEEFLQTIRRNPGLKLLGLKTGGKGKAKRFERVLQPALASGLVKISDADTPFLRALRKELADYPNGRHDDTLDAVYWALRGMPDVLTGQSVFDEITVGKPRERGINPFAVLAKM